MSNRAKLALGLALLAGLPVMAVSTKFSNFTPLTSSAGPLPVDGPEEATPAPMAATSCGAGSSRGCRTKGSRSTRTARCISSTS